MKFNLQRRRQSNYYLYLQRMANKPGVGESLGIVLSLLTVSFFVVFAIKPSLAKIAELNKEIEVTENTLTRLKKKSVALTQVAKIWARVSGESQKIEKTIPLGPDYSYFVKEMEWVANQNKVRYVNGTFTESLLKSDLLDPYQINQKLSPIEIKVNLRFEGDYAELLKTLNQLTNIDRLLEINTVSINQNDKKDKLGQLVMTLNGKIYYFGNKTELEKILQPVKKK